MNDWKKVIISPGFSIREAIQHVDAKGERIALVVDESGFLQGTITDGDIRRGLLSGVSLDQACTNVMCSNPIVAYKGYRKNKIKALFNDHRLMHLPVVDDDNLLCGLEALDEYSQLTSSKDNPVFLMAGGFGTRLKPLTNACPKPMLRIAEKPILQLILESFIKSGFHDFYISLHYMPEIIQNYFGDGRDWGVSIQYVYEDSPLGTGGALGLLPHDKINAPLILMNGDLLTNVNFIELIDYHGEDDSIATMCVHEYEHQIPFGVIETKGTHVLSIQEKPIKKFMVNAGIYVLSPDLIKRVGIDEHIDMPTLLDRSVEASENVSIFPIHEYWLDIGRKADLSKAQVEAGDIH